MSVVRSFKLIGDPHITRKFEVGVPLARRGERERLLFEDFSSQLQGDVEDVIIMVGDLFEKPICSLQDLFSILSLILTTAQANPTRTYVMMAGNHDISAQRDDKGAFDILNLFHGLVPNLIIAMKPTLVGRIGVFPWEWDRTALEQLEDAKDWEMKVAVGHWDLVAYHDMHDDHMCPAEELVAMGVEEIYSGHWHVPGEYKVAGHVVHCTGSMQPMTHAEDPEGKLYVTLTLEEYEAADPEKLKNKYVRVRIEDGEEVDRLEDCLGFKVQKIKTDTTGPEPQVQMEGFKMAEVMKKSFEKHGVPQKVRQHIEDCIDASD